MPLNHRIHRSSLHDCAGLLQCGLLQCPLFETIVYGYHEVIIIELGDFVATNLAQ